MQVMAGMTWLDLSTPEATEEGMPQLVKRVKRARDDKTAFRYAIEWEGSGVSTSAAAKEAAGPNEDLVMDEDEAMTILGSNLQAFLENHGFKALAVKLVEQEIMDMETLLLMEGDADLKDLGLTKGARLKLWKAMK